MQGDRGLGIIDAQMGDVTVRLRVVLVNIAMLLLVATVSAQDVIYRGVEQKPRFKPDSPEKTAPFLQVLDVILDGRKLVPGDPLPDPDWIARAEFVLHNVSPYEVTGGTLSFSFNGARTAIALAFGCEGLAGCPPGEDRGQAILIRPGQKIVLNGYRDSRFYKRNIAFFQGAAGRVDLTLYWMGFNTADGMRWSDWQIIPSQH